MVWIKERNYNQFIRTRFVHWNGGLIVDRIQLNRKGEGPYERLR